MWDKKENLNEERVLQALGTVIEPELHRDLVSLKMVRDVRITGNDVSLTIMLTTPACPLKGQMEADARRALAAVPGIGAVAIKWDANVPADARISGRVSNLHVRATVAVASGKGGVGKSTVSVNLAVSLARLGARVGLLDADIYGPNVPLMMGVDQMPPVDAVQQKMVPAVAYGVELMSMAFLARPDQPIIWRGPMLNSAIRQFLMDVLWGDLDYLIVDLPPGTGDAALSLAQAVPLTGAVVVTTPQQVARMDVVRSIEMFKKLDVPLLGIVENMSYFPQPDGQKVYLFGQGGGRRLAEEYDVPLLGEVPLDPQVGVGGDNGQPIVVSAPDSPAGQALLAAAQTVAARVSVLNLQQSDVIPLVRMN
jgi:ATP-binding protein involved in chromosome partitioning